MAFWSKWVNQAGQIDSLSRDLDFEQRRCKELESLLEREEFRNKALEKEVLKARNSEIRTLRHHADVISKTVKASSTFTTINEPPPPPPPPDATMLEKTRWAAEQMRQIDIDDGITPFDVEYYESLIKENPEQYLTF